jgi:hypothetical protein
MFFEALIVFKCDHYLFHGKIQQSVCCTCDGKRVSEVSADQTVIDVSLNSEDVGRVACMLSAQKVLQRAMQVFSAVCCIPTAEAERGIFGSAINQGTV